MTCPGQCATRLRSPVHLSAVRLALTATLALVGAGGCATEDTSSVEPGSYVALAEASGLAIRGARHGRVADLTAQQIKDLAEFLLSQ